MMVTKAALSPISLFRVFALTVALAFAFPTIQAQAGESCRRAVEDLSSIKLGPLPETGAVEYVVLNIADPNPKILNPQMEIVKKAGPGVKFLISTLSFFKKNIEGELNGTNLSPQIEYLELGVNQPSSTWTRDFSPVQIKDADGNYKLIQFRYAKGEVEANAFAELLAQRLKFPLEKVNLIFEPGNLMSDVRGNIFVTDRAFLNAEYDFTGYPDLMWSMDKNWPLIKRNKKEVSDVLKASLRAKNVVWLNDIPYEFERTGHVDLMAKIINLDTVVVANSKIPAVKEVLDQAAEVFRKNGYSKIVRIMNADNKEMEGTLLSYTNALRVGNRILIPKYGQATDLAAKAAYEALGLQVELVDGSSIEYGGSVHCLSYQY